jgi:uncharacterized membrane protein
MLLSCIGVAVYATRYFLIPPNEDHFSRYLLPLRLHIAGGMGALPAGPWQFSEKLRTRALNWHRWLGRFYLLEVALGSIAGLVMAMVSEQSLPTHLGFGMLASLWFFTGLEAYRMVRRGNTVAHRQWMIRNFALTLCRGHFAKLHAAPAIRPALVFPAKLHHRFLVVMGSESARRGMASAPPARSGALGVLIRLGSHRAPLFLICSHLLAQRIFVRF